MTTIKGISFVIFTAIIIIAAPFISLGIYWLICEACIDLIIITLSFIFGNLTANLVINIVTTNFGFYLFYLFIFTVLIRWNLQLFGLKTVFDSWTGQKMKTLATKIGRVMNKFKERNKKREKSQQEEKSYARTRCG